MRFLSRKDVRAKVSLSFAHLSRLETEGRFPKRVPLTGAHRGRVAWIEEEVEAWMRERMQKRNS